MERLTTEKLTPIEKEGRKIGIFERRKGFQSKELFVFGEINYIETDIRAERMKSSSK